MYNAKTWIYARRMSVAVGERAIWDTVEAYIKNRGAPGAALKQLQLFE